MIKTLFGKILLMSLVIILVVSGVTGVVMDFFIKRFILYSKEQEMIRQGERVINSIVRYMKQRDNIMVGMMHGRGMWVMRIAGMIRELEKVLGARIWLVDRNGLIYAESDLVRELNENELKQLLSGKKITKFNWNDELNQPILAVALPININNEVIGGLFIITPMEEVHIAQSRIRRLMIGSTLIGTLVAVFLAILFSRHLTRPLLAMQNLIHKMRKGDFSGQLEIKRGDELGDLARHINDLNRELDKTIDLLRTEQEQTQRIINSMAEGVISLNQMGEVVVINPAARRILKIPDSGPADLQDVFEKLPGLEEQVIKVQQERAPLMREIELNNQVFLSIVSPICTGEDQVLGVVIVLQDITNRWRLVQLQKELIANVSHEFKTPLTSIKGFVELMLDHKIKDEVAVQNSLKIIHSETLRLIRMVNDLLKMARMESLRLRKEPTDLLELVQKVVDSLALRLEETGVTVQLDSSLKRKMDLDPDRMEQVFYNLLDNGIRFSPPGGIIEIKAIEDNGKVKIQIRDQGPGIPEEEKELIFDRFYKVEKARSTNEAGSGLGLAIVKSIVEEHGGQIWADNYPEGGAVFVIEMPK
ncbi:hypothetical protein BBF96_15475 [Anoxybacter fermentans]|uniref:histidine kinase n=2 Tax=Bacteria TaxID=2 RepID=A0A3S9T287_9FIRM|nr:ATP-binding protein [Anoxybacter fermentans]AZR74649.1 hypothetical protein BBF96_15475 [Anoxybacter fermentans]